MRVLVGSLLAFGCCFSQTPPPSFEVASVKPAAHPGTNAMPRVFPPAVLRIGIPGGGPPANADPGTLRYTGISLKLLVQIAYDLPPSRISGPGWLDSETYDIVAKIPAGTAKDQVNPMLQSLLAERFGLAFHRETRELPIYELTVAKGGLKMKESTLADAASPPTPRPGGGGNTLRVDGSGFPVAPAGFRSMTGLLSQGGATILGNGQTVRSLLIMLMNELDRPVVDKTGLTGAYDFRLTFMPAAGIALPEPPPGSATDVASEPAPNLQAALSSQLGLKLESAKGPVEMLVIDRANKTPTEN